MKALSLRGIHALSDAEAHGWREREKELLLPLANVPRPDAPSLSGSEARGFLADGWRVGGPFSA
jgi:hypothetical protein